VLFLYMLFCASLLGFSETLGKPAVVYVDNVTTNIFE